MKLNNIECICLLLYIIVKQRIKWRYIQGSPYLPSCSHQDKWSLAQVSFQCQQVCFLCRTCSVIIPHLSTLCTHSTYMAIYPITGWNLSKVFGYLEVLGTNLMEDFQINCWSQVQYLAALSYWRLLMVWSHQVDYLQDTLFLIVEVHQSHLECLLYFRKQNEWEKKSHWCM